MGRIDEDINEIHESIKEANRNNTSHKANPQSKDPVDDKGKLDYTITY